MPDEEPIGQFVRLVATQNTLLTEVLRELRDIKERLGNTDNILRDRNDQKPSIEAEGLPL